MARVVACELQEMQAVLRDMAREAAAVRLRLSPPAHTKFDVTEAAAVPLPECTLKLGVFFYLGTVVAPPPHSHARG